MCIITLDIKVHGLSVGPPLDLIYITYTFKNANILAKCSCTCDADVKFKTKIFCICILTKSILIY